LEDEMKKVTLTKQIVFAGLTLWFAIMGCGLLTIPANEVRTESQSVSVDSATSASVQIEFPAGELKVQSGSSNLMDASFRYNVDEWQPQVNYSESGAQGELIVSQPGSDQLPSRGGLINEWKLLLTNDIPLDLSIRAGAGNNELNLGGLDLAALNIESGAGNTKVYLDGNWDHDVLASIKGGVGNLTVNLPAEMGVLVIMDTALVNVSANGLIVAENGYVNQAYGSAPYTFTLNLEVGVGSVTLVVPQQ